MKTRLSKLQKNILVVINELDKKECEQILKGKEKGIPVINFPWCFHKSENPPYLHKLRATSNTIESPFPGVPFGAVIDPGVKQLTEDLTKENGSVFDATFSRTIKNMASKDLIEIANRNNRSKKSQGYGIALMPKGQEVLKLISTRGKLNNKKERGKND